MKKLFFLFVFAAIGVSAHSQERVHGYYRSNGKHVNSYRRTYRNETNWDNYSTRRNPNPYTGKRGSRARDYSPQAYNYGRGHTIYKGYEGGQYYISKKGRKTYVPKRR